jgi:hypothetical protein
MREAKDKTGADAGASTGPGAGASAGAGRGRLGRRRFVRAGVGLALLLGGSAVAVVRTRGYALPAGKALEGLSVWQFVVVQHAARRIAAADRPGDATIPSPDDADVASFVDAWVARMHASVRRDLGRFLGYLEHLAPVSAGMASRFSRLGAEDQDRVLAAVEASSSDLLRAGFDGLKSLVFMGYYRDPRTWRILGYDGPQVGRPEKGWW